MKRLPIFAASISVVVALAALAHSAPAAPLDDLMTQDQAEMVDRLTREYGKILVDCRRASGCGRAAGRANVGLPDGA
ncbi:MAG: hypothetical protein HYY46_01790 [Deltaproteobacteria bacterium]|nr:hypothetical protein [Deltaproteobacteria bacterium]